MIDVFTEPDAWNGGSIEALLWFEAAPQESPLLVLDVAWNWGDLTGPVSSSLESFASQARVDIESIKVEDHPSLYGVATLPNGASVPFASHLMIEEGGFFLTAGVPLGALSGVYPAVGAYPFEGSSTDPWALEVYGWLAAFARHVFEACAFTSGLVGWITTLEFDEVERGTVPDERFHGYLTTSGSRLKYLEPNVSGSLMTVGSR